MTRIGIAGIAILLIAIGLLLTGPNRQPSHADDGSGWSLVAGSLSPQGYTTGAYGGLNAVDVVGVDPATTGLTYARLTSGTCDSLGDEATIYEGQLSPEPDGHYLTAALYPVGLGVGSIPLSTGGISIGPFDPTATPPGHVLIAGFEGGPPNTTFHLCLRHPGPYTYCVHYKGGLLCQAQFALQPNTPTAIPGSVATPASETPVATIPPGVPWCNGTFVSGVCLPPLPFPTPAPSGTAVTAITPAPLPVTTPAPSGQPLPLLASGWTEVGAAASDDGGAWRFKQTVGQDLLGAGLTVMRVTSGACATPAEQAVAFEAQLQATEAGDQSWAGQLLPVGAPAQALVLDPTSGDVHFVPMPTGTLVDAALDGVPPDTAFVICVRRP